MKISWDTHSVTALVPNCSVSVILYLFDSCNRFLMLSGILRATIALPLAYLSHNQRHIMKYWLCSVLIKSITIYSSYLPYWTITLCLTWWRSIPIHVTYFTEFLSYISVYLVYFVLFIVSNWLLPGLLHKVQHVAGHHAGGLFRSEFSVLWLSALEHFWKPCKKTNIEHPYKTFFINLLCVEIVMNYRHEIRFLWVSKELTVSLIVKIHGLFLWKVMESVLKHCLNTDGNWVYAQQFGEICLLYVSFWYGLFGRICELKNGKKCWSETSIKSVFFF